MQPKDYAEQARERIARADDRLKAKTTNRQRVLLGFAAFVAIIVTLAVVKSCG